MPHSPPSCTVKKMVRGLLAVHNASRFGGQRKAAVYESTAIHCRWEGVTYYLTDEAINSTMRLIARCSCVRIAYDTCLQHSELRCSCPISVS